MAKAQRVDGLNTTFHFIFRGNDRESLFLDYDDRFRFVKRLELVARESGATCLACALMKNHGHICIRTGEKFQLAEIVHRLAGWYAMYFNKRYGRTGHVFEDFRSKVIDNEAYLQAVIRYVLLNPLLSNLVPDLDALARHTWTSYSTMKRQNGLWSFVDGDQALMAFGADPVSGLRALEQSMAERIQRARAEHNPADFDSTFAEKQQDREPVHRLIQKVCEQLHVTPTDVIQGRRAGADARAVIAFLGTSALGLSQSFLASKLGVTQQAIGKSLLRGREIADRHGLTGLWNGGQPQPTT